MRRLITLALSSALILPAAPSMAASPVHMQAPAATGTLTGTAASPTGQPIPGTTVRARSLPDNEVAATTTSSATGAFTFPGLLPGTYVVEVVSQTGAIIGVGAATSVVAGVTTTVAVTTTAAAAAAAAAAGGVAAGGAAAGGAAAAGAAAGGAAAAGIGLTTAAVVASVAAAAGIAAAVVVAQDDASPSR